MKSHLLQRSSRLITSKPRKRVSQRLRSPSGDERLARDFERILESEHEYRLIYMKATGKSYDEACGAFEQAKHDAVVALTTNTQEYINKTAAALGCTCDKFRFPESERFELRARSGRHHKSSCGQSTG